MNSRFIWNFEFDPSISLAYPEHSEKEQLRWEARFFWTENEIIVLKRLDHSFLSLIPYEIKFRQDCYVLLPEGYNIKRRHDQLLYKPLLDKKGGLCGFAKKINLNNQPVEALLPGTTIDAGTLLAHINHQGHEITVNKEALIYTFPIKPKMKLELSRLEIAGVIYYSVCIEGHSAFLVTQLSNQLLASETTSDYLSFLKTMT